MDTQPPTWMIQLLLSLPTFSPFASPEAGAKEMQKNSNSKLELLRLQRELGLQLIRGIQRWEEAGCTGFSRKQDRVSEAPLAIREDRKRAPGARPNTATEGPRWQHPW